MKKYLLFILIYGLFTALSAQADGFCLFGCTEEINNSTAYKKTQTNIAQSKNQDRLQKEHSAMQSFLNALMAENWKEAEKHSYSLVNLPTVNNDKLIKFIGHTKILTEQIKEYDQVKLERSILNGKLEKANQTINAYTQKFEKLLKTAKSTITAKNNELNQITTKFETIAKNNKKAQDLLGRAKTSIEAKALNTAEGNKKAAKEIYFEILSLSPNNPYVEATVGLFYGIPKKYKSLGFKQHFKWLNAYETNLKKGSTLEFYLKKFNAGGYSADLEFDSISSKLKKAKNFLNKGNFDDAIKVYRRILSQNTDTESAKFGLTVLVPLYYLLNNEIESALLYLEHLEDDARANYYDFFKNSISKLSNINKLLVDAEKKDQVILASLDGYFQQYSKLLKEAQNSNSGFLQHEVEPNTIESKVQKVFGIVNEYIRLIQDDLKDEKEAYEHKMSSLSYILNSTDCKSYYYNSLSSSYYWVYSTCVNNLKKQLQQKQSQEEQLQQQY